VRRGGETREPVSECQPVNLKIFGTEKVLIFEVSRGFQGSAVIHADGKAGESLNLCFSPSELPFRVSGKDECHFGN
jgi:hypothetical protein